ncbi:MAG: MATE family efflux transporter [Deltaproteobacteria bacterium]|nr:MATE family efflux transporter [Deltaproteobacteria bacterium]MCW5806349.1 MATE family efflux transporter [Deltaproteobacteria bacterium]
MPAESTRLRLWRLSAPIIGINTLNVLMLAVDSALCGRLPESKVALAALGYSVQVVFLLMVAMLGLLVGTVALVARAYGGKDTSRVNHIIQQATTLTALVGVTVGVVGAIAARGILTVLGASDVVASVGADYLRPLMIGTPFFYLTLLYTGIMRGVGNTKIPFVCAIVANVVNAVLNYALVLGNLGAPSLGVTGSAISTVAAQLLNVVILIVVLRRGTVAGLRPTLRPAKLDRGLAVELSRIGWPAAIDMLVLNVGFLAAIGMLGHIDDATVAAHGLGMRVQSLAFVPGLSIAQATGALVGQALGAGDVPRAREVVRASLFLCVTIMTVLALIIVIAAHPLVQIFGEQGEGIEAHAIDWMRLLGLAMLPAAIHIAMVGLLQGSGATMTSLRINFITMLLQVPVAYILGFTLGLGAIGVWLSFPISFVGKAALAYGAYRGNKWAVTGIRMPAKK